LYSPTEVGSPFTVSITPEGAVSVTTGVVGALDSATYIREQAQRHMTLTMRAKSPEGVPLFCEWKASGGGLSSAQELRTTYLPQSQEWESIWQWRFPADAKAGDLFTIEGFVKDDYGNQAPVGLGAGNGDPFVVQAGDPSVRVAFFTTRHGAREVYSINGDGTGETRLTETSVTEYGPKWSPDGERMVFGRSDSSGGGNVDLYLVNADGTGEIRLTNTGAGGRNNTDPIWSSDGTRIAFWSSREGLGNGDIFVMNADGSNETNITNCSPRSPSGPAGPPCDRIVYAYDGNIYTINFDGTDQTQLTTNGGPNSSQPRNERPSWSPDESQIVFYSTRDGNGEIYVMDADGDNQVNLTNEPEHDAAPIWSPDGSQIVFYSRRNGITTTELFVMGNNGANPINLSNHSQRDEYPAWSPD
jgi:WD40 repeat protein